MVCVWPFPKQFRLLPPRTREEWVVEASDTLLGRSRGERDLVSGSWVKVTSNTRAEIDLSR